MLAFTSYEQENGQCLWSFCSTQKLKTTKHDSRMTCIPYITVVLDGTATGYDIDHIFNANYSLVRKKTSTIVRH